jgi:hypothetical protein
VVLAALFAAAAAPANAQGLARFSIDSTVSLDAVRGDNASDRPQVVVDISASVRLSDEWQLLVRPWFRQARPSTPAGAVPPWDTVLYQAGARYEHAGPIAVRVDLGSIISPIGLGLFDSRPNLNPTVLAHIGYVVPMPVFEAGAPRTVPIANTYPIGAQATASTNTWDIRAAVVNSAPTRSFQIGNSANPKAAPAFEAGAGVTPTVGLRFGVSFAHGTWAKAEELTRPTLGDLSTTLVGAEAEYAFRYTKVAGEFVRTSFQTSSDDAVAYEWFVQGTQTLTPRFFAAARREGTSAPPLETGIIAGQTTHLDSFEGTLGFRVTPDVTLRGGYYARRSYGATVWDNQATVSVVYAHRWW